MHTLDSGQHLPAWAATSSVPPETEKQEAAPSPIEQALYLRVSPVAARSVAARSRSSAARLMRSVVRVTW
ncbi:hypothetical protein EES39_36055 [Streptomyces sp. ADI92-24]|nr:hypothetical protein EDD95_6451 [Streptomyces sp. CEV 2-1]RPK33691.1 hypothetical protein EES39_36055 [Streptomyces sp. ADI92-24]